MRSFGINNNSCFICVVEYRNNILQGIIVVFKYRCEILGEVEVKMVFTKVSYKMQVFNR